MQIERKALYNLLRIKALREPGLAVEPWQIEDYRLLNLNQLYERLAKVGVHLDDAGFEALAENCESPEELADSIVSEEQDASRQDQIYLLVFEVWRKLIPEQLCMSIFCDELDYQIFQYDHGEDPNPIAIQDALANLESLLHQGTDEGEEPVAVFESIASGCAHDLESFLYDFIAEQIDHDNTSYASDLVDAFYDYISDITWFDFLRARLLAETDPSTATEVVAQIIEDTREHPELELNLELLGFVAQGGDARLFCQLVQRSLPLIRVEEDLHDLLELCSEYFRLADQDQQEAAVQKILRDRGVKDLEGLVVKDDRDISRLREIVERSLKSKS